jgi:ABC-type multidrug transport system fused ATPase/permease subunit
MLVLFEYASYMQQLFWPISIKTAPQWMSIMIVLATIWKTQFINLKTPIAAKKQKEEKRIQIEGVMRATLEYTKCEDAKKEKDRNLPEASRVLGLIWDDSREVRTTFYGIPLECDLNTKTEALFKRVHRLEMEKVISKTRAARQALNKQYTADSVNKDDGSILEALKELGEHESGEKLREMIVFAERIKKKVGEEYTDIALLQEAKLLANEVTKDQSKNVASLLKLLGPVLPLIIVTIFISVFVAALRARFHQIGPWQQSVDAAATGDRATALAIIGETLAGHWVIHFFGILKDTYDKRASIQFSQRVRSGVLSAMLRQDYEYFDKTSPGILQERLNRDANELGENLITFPRRMLERITIIVTILYLVLDQMPFALFSIAILPVLFTICMQIFMFDKVHQSEERERKMTEEGVSVTSEILREVKTVRQFAMEPCEAANFARNETTKTLMVEECHTFRVLMDRFTWAVFEGGLVVVLYCGYGYVERGEMTSTQLIDSWIKLNFWLMFHLKDLIEDLPKMWKLLTPLGRICDLLQSSPLIEPPTAPLFVDAKDPAELKNLLAKCDIVEHKSGKLVADIRTMAPSNLVIETAATSFSGKQHSVTTEGGDDDSTKASGSTATTKDRQLVALRSYDDQHLNIADKNDIRLGELEYPVRAIFSNKLRPTRFKGKIEFRNVRFRFNIFNIWLLVALACSISSFQVHFAYPTDLRKPMLQGINFTVEPGQKVALVGATGCGKSTCMSLLQRLYEPQQGVILIDDHPLQDYVGLQMLQLSIIPIV